MEFNFQFSFVRFAGETIVQEMEGFAFWFQIFCKDEYLPLTHPVSSLSREKNALIGSFGNQQSCWEAKNKEPFGCKGYEECKQRELHTYLDQKMEFLWYTGAVFLRKIKRTPCGGLLMAFSLAKAIMTTLGVFRDQYCRANTLPNQGWEIILIKEMKYLPTAKYFSYFEHQPKGI